MSDDGLEHIAFAPGHGRWVLADVIDDEPTTTDVAPRHVPRQRAREDVEGAAAARALDAPERVIGPKGARDVDAPGRRPEERLRMNGREVHGEGSRSSALRSTEPW